MLILQVISLTVLHAMELEPDHGENTIPRPEARTSAEMTDLQRQVMAARALPGAVGDIFDQFYVEQERLAEFVSRYPQNIHVALQIPPRTGSLLSGWYAGGPASCTDNMERKTLKATPSAGDILVWKGGNPWDFVKGTVAEDTDGTLKLRDVQINFCPLTAEMLDDPEEYDLPPFPQEMKPTIGDETANVEFTCKYDSESQKMMTEDRQTLPSSGHHGADRQADSYQTLAKYPTIDERKSSCCGHGVFTTAELEVKALPDDYDEDEILESMTDYEEVKRDFRILNFIANYWLDTPAGQIWTRATLDSRGSLSMPGDIEEVLSQVGDIEDDMIEQILSHPEIRDDGDTPQTMSEKVRRIMAPENYQATWTKLKSMPCVTEGHSSSDGKQGKKPIVHSRHRGNECITQNFMLDVPPRTDSADVPGDSPHSHSPILLATFTIPLRSGPSSEGLQTSPRAGGDEYDTIMYDTPQAETEAAQSTVTAGTSLETTEYPTRTFEVAFPSRASSSPRSDTTQ